MLSFEQSLQHAPRIDGDKPLLIYKVGILGSAPLDFMPELAKKYAMPYVSSDKIRHDLMVERQAQGMSPAMAQDVQSRSVQHAVHRQAGRHLAEGGDVVVDMFVNNPKGRTSMHNIAQRRGGLAIGLVLNTPMQQALERVEAWTEAEEFEPPVNRWPHPPMSITRAMGRHIVRPQRSEGGLFLDVDGTGTTQDLLDQVEAHFHAADLKGRSGNV